MKLYIDAGNSAIKCLFQGHGGVRHLRIASNNYRESLEGELSSVTGLDEIWVSSVLGPDFQAFLVDLSRRLNLPNPVFIRIEDVKTGISIAYKNKESFGVDRYLALLAADQQFNKDVIVIDVGTAITVDAMKHPGIHMGGIIMPGLELMQKSLGAGTVQINDVEAGACSTFSTNTGDAVFSGCYYAAVGGLNNIIDLMSQYFKTSPLIVMTGGASELVVKGLNYECCIKDNLVIDGLRILAKLS